MWEVAQIVRAAADQLVDLVKVDGWVVSHMGKEQNDMAEAHGEGIGVVKVMFDWEVSL